MVTGFAIQTSDRRIVLGMLHQINKGENQNGVTTDIRSQFLTDTDNTGRMIVLSKRTKKQYWVEPIGDPHIMWGSVTSYATGELAVKKGWKKYRGSIDKQDSLISEENGFDKVHELDVGQSPLLYIDKIDAQYPDKAQ